MKLPPQFAPPVDDGYKGDALSKSGWAPQNGPKLHSNESAARKQELLLRAADIFDKRLQTSWP